MDVQILYALTGVSLFVLSLYALIVHADMIRRLIALNVMSSAVFLEFIALANRNLEGSPPDPVPHAMVLTGIVVAISMTAVALALVRRISGSGVRNTPEDRH